MHSVYVGPIQTSLVLPGLFDELFYLILWWRECTVKTESYFEKPRISFHIVPLEPRYLLESLSDRYIR